MTFVGAHCNMPLPLKIFLKRHFCIETFFTCRKERESADFNLRSLPMNSEFQPATAQTKACGNHSWRDKDTADFAGFANFIGLAI
ncbi:MAG: hypothetical protein DCC43_07375 [Candidatus Brocadia sp.]|jgi:hypothetical protein|nr:hypothetical protein [Candidatus Brocadia sp. AMX3]OQY99569.1 MAG: hypothetical protein B6D35_08860 [Candidatus Brocadia sp. UTAMX2]RIK00129.1 MAG: hypothetical protein DCC43_07375 [Candidatus Brocadia sp.]